MKAQRDRSDLFQVMEKRCDQCLFSSNKIVDEHRKAQVLEHCQETGTHFICHKATIAGNMNVCCRAFYDTRDDILVVQLAKALGRVVFVDVPDGKVC